MSEQTGYDKVPYDSGYEQEKSRRSMRIRGWDAVDVVGPAQSEAKDHDNGFVERNNVRDRL